MTALLAPAKKNLDQAVSDNKITQAQETAILSKITTALTNLVNNTRPSNAQKMSTTQMSIMRHAMLTTLAKRH